MFGDVAFGDAPQCHGGGNRRPLRTASPTAPPPAASFAPQTRAAQTSVDETIARPQLRTGHPSMYKVVMLNDDYTPMEFVVEVLQRFFGKSSGEANAIMLEIHNRGSSVCGIYTYEVAETKVSLVMDHARRNQHPLQCTLEKA